MNMAPLHALHIPLNPEEQVAFVHFDGGMGQMRERLAEAGTYREMQVEGIVLFDYADAEENERAIGVGDVPHGDAWYVSVDATGDFYGNVDPSIISLCYGHEPYLDDEGMTYVNVDDLMVPLPFYLMAVEKSGDVEMPACCDGSDPDERDGDEPV